MSLKQMILQMRYTDNSPWYFCELTGVLLVLCRLGVIEQEEVDAVIRGY